MSRRRAIGDGISRTGHNDVHPVADYVAMLCTVHECNCKYVLSLLWGGDQHNIER